MDGFYRGCRATRDGGYWEFFRGKNGGAMVAAELFAFADGRLTSEDHVMLKEEVRSTMEAATQGRLLFGEQEDVREIWREPDMCELRLGFTSFDDSERQSYKYRLYFAEPTSVQMLLLALLFGRKPATEQGLDVQDEHIDEAGERYTSWVREQVA